MKIILPVLLPILFLYSSNISYSQKSRTAAISFKDDTTKVRKIFKNIDDHTLDWDTKMSVYADNVIHMAQGSRAVTGKDSLRKVLETEARYGHSVMTHYIIDLLSYDYIVVVRGRVTGNYYSNNGGAAIPFETNNLFIFDRTKDGTLKVSKVIFNRIDLDSEQKNKNPFKKFIGEWTLKNDDWTQNWGQGTEHIKIPNHHTVCRELNTANSLLAIIDGAPPHGHIFWTYNPIKKEVGHLSSFGESRIGVGKGSVNENGDVTLKVSFEGEAEGTYRIYTYKWVSDDEYDLKSIQYNDKDEPTGFLYGGTFVRIIKN
ncbi:MAG: hypothetical protein ABIR18_15000 [Chitinophagaceae bacterium]